MKQVPLSHIKIDKERIRRHFDEERISQLADSIESKGLLHPVVVRYDAELDLVLVAGERRLRAIALLHKAGRPFKVVSHDEQMIPVEHNHIPASFLSELAADDILEAELEENVCRLDLSWQERADAVGRLHVLRKKQAEEKGEKHSMLDTNREIFDDPRKAAETRSMITLSKHLTDDLVRTAPDPRTAMKILRKKAADDLSSKYADFLRSQANEDEDPTLFNMDGIAAMMLPDNEHKFDVILTDPPYGVDADTFNNFTSIHSHEYKDTVEGFKQLMEGFALGAAHCTRADAHLYMFCDIRHWDFLTRILSQVWTIWPWPIIWNKRGHGLVPSKDFGPSRQYEMILYARRGRKYVTGIQSDVVSTAPARNKVHAAQKPIVLLKDLLGRSLLPGEGSVIDPFAGSGSTIIAAREMQLEVKGYEIDENTYKRALIRIATETGDEDDDPSNTR